MLSANTIVITERDGYFYDLVVYLFSFQSFAHSVEIYNAGSAKTWPDDDVVLIDAKQANMRLTWAPAPLLQLVCANQKPSIIEFTEEPNPLSDAGNLALGAIDPLLFSFGQSLITNYYERYLDQIGDTFGKDMTNWPSVWNFGRVIRNAMSHGGRINIRNPNAAPVKWRGLSYSSKENGRLILHTDIWPGDLYYLLRDLEAPRKQFNPS
jgi:hypothetical protein